MTRKARISVSRSSSFGSANGDGVTETDGVWVVTSAHYLATLTNHPVLGPLGAGDPFTVFAVTIFRSRSATYYDLGQPAHRFARYVLAMLTLISCRESSVNAHEFGPHVITGDQEFFNGGPLAQPIFIHGYNCTEDQVAKEYIRFSAALKQDCIAYSWPGGCHPLDFPAAVGRADLAGYRLRDVFSMRYLRQSNENVITHSLGARVALTALKGGLLRVKNLILMGAAVDWNVFNKGAEFERVPACCESIHVLYSNHDDVLKLAFPLSDFGGDHRALGLDGPREPLEIPENVVLHDTSSFIDNHAGYLTNSQCFELVSRILE